jgi:hypothetical protein
MTLVIRFEAGLRPILKHQEHDQSSHGSWAKGSSESDYQMSHRPSLGSGTEGDMDGASLDNVSNGIYPDDVYSPRGVQIYGTGYKELDKQAHALIMEYRGKPEKSITIYRAIPKDASTSKISGGEWVTPIKQYAVQHGQSNLNDDYQILTREVKAKEIFTSGDSWLEWGYAPSTVQKHQDHDQKTHGNWATGGGDTAINKFENAANQAYGTGEEAFTIDYTGDNSVAALGEYLARGHLVNDNIRSSATMGEAGYIDLGDGKTYADSSVVKGLDNAIEMAPPMPNQKVWRTASAEAIENLKVNGVYIDKGFTSTTAVDITHPDNGMLLLALSSVSSGRKALMEIDTGSVGKGLYIPKMFPGQPIAEKEREFLLPRETKMRYLGSDLNISPSGKTIVEIHKFKVED